MNAPEPELFLFIELNSDEQTHGCGQLHSEAEIAAVKQQRLERWRRDPNTPLLITVGDFASGQYCDVCRTVLTPERNGE